MVLWFDGWSAKWLVDGSITEFHESYTMVFQSYMCAGAPERPAGYPHPLSRYPGGPRTYVEARDRWLVKPIRTTRKDWTEPVRL